MGCWSAENATNAYLKTLKMGQKAKEPEAAEFISALAAGNNAQLMVVAGATAAGSTVLALVAAAHQTGGRVVCILPGHKELHQLQQQLGFNACRVEFISGDPKNLIQTRYSEADFVLIDCKLDNHEEILRAVRRNGALVVGYNAFSRGSWWSTGSKTQLLPIGDGLLVTRIGLNGNGVKVRSRAGHKRSNSNSQWVVRVDKCTGEEHCFRVRIPQGKQIEA